MKTFGRKHKPAEAPPSVQGVGSLIGTSTVSLDGESVILPGDMRYDGDDVSSIATSNDGGPPPPPPPPQPVKMANGGEPEEPSLWGDDPSLLLGAVPAPFPETEASGSPLDDDDDDLSKGGWLPSWVTGASPLLKGVIYGSAALLVVAVILVIVAAAVQSGEDSGGGTTTSKGTSGAIDTPTPPATIVTAIPSAAPSNSPAPTSPTSAPEPTQQPSSQPTVTQSVSPTETLAPSFGEMSTTIYVTAGRFQGENLADLPNVLAALPTEDNTAFLVHLGDWNSPFATGCEEYSYEAVNELYSSSSVPVYFVVGDNEFNDCPDPKKALKLWYQYLLDYPTQYWQAPPYAVSRQTDHQENFAFTLRKVQYIGINLVGGVKHDDEEWDNRIRADLDWIRQQWVSNRDDISFMVVFLHADPDITNVASFYEKFDRDVKDKYDVPVIVVHRNLGVESFGYETVDGITDYVFLTVEGQVLPVMRLRIDITASPPVRFNQDNWFDSEVGSV